MNALRIVEQQILTKVVKKLPGIADRIFVGLDEFFGKGSLVTFDTAVDPWATRVAPVMGDVLSAEQSIELPFELLPVIGLDVLDGHRTEALQLFEEVPGIAAVEAGIRQGESQLAFDVNGRVEIHL